MSRSIGSAAGWLAVELSLAAGAVLAWGGGVSACSCEHAASYPRFRIQLVDVDAPGATDHQVLYVTQAWAAFDVFDYGINRRGRPDGLASVYALSDDVDAWVEFESVHRGCR